MGNKGDAPFENHPEEHIGEDAGICCLGKFNEKT